MRAFFKSLDERVWISIEKGWTKPSTNIDSRSKDNLNVCNWNSKGLHVIFLIVSLEEFKRIYV
jgi:hypothetical protein